MSGNTKEGVRLDGSTLRVLEAYHYGEAADWYASGECRAVAEWHQRECERLRDLADKAEARAPMFSDWVRACEGTALGEPQVIPSWELRAGSAGDFAHVDFVPGAADVVVTSYVKPIGEYDDGHREARTRCSTPTELRAALEHLAAEVKP